MINTLSVRAVDASKLNEHFGKPLYESYNFAHIPTLITHLLTGAGDLGLPADVLGDLPRRYHKVILVFVDAFGWCFFERYADQHPFLKRIVADGVVSKLTTQFPSTTAAHVTTIHTGQPVNVSGIYEWFYYEPAVDHIIAPLLFGLAGDKGRNTLQGHTTPAVIYPNGPTLYQRLAAQGVTSHVLMSDEFALAPFSQMVTRGAQVTPFRTIPEALVNITDAILAAPGPAYCYVYFSPVDYIAHHYGPYARQTAAEIETLLDALERLLHGNLAGNTHDTLLLITADHGQVEVSPHTTVYLNQRIPDLTPYIQRNRQGQLLVPAGSPRDMFLHIQPEHLDAAEALLRRELDGVAGVYRTADLMAQGLFGLGEPSPTLTTRVGNLALLAYPGETVWWYEKDRFEQNFYGHHGSLTSDEMHTILLAYPYM
jgi:hypothetical protein